MLLNLLAIVLFMLTPALVPAVVHVIGAINDKRAARALPATA